MGFFQSLFGKTENKKVGNQPEQAVIIYFDYGKEGLEPFHLFEKMLEEAIIKNKVGEYDGHEIALDYSDGILYMYGPNAENLFKAVEPTLKNTSFMDDARVKLRFGPPEDGVKEIIFKL